MLVCSRFKIKKLDINIGDKCRIKKKDVLFEDKMTAKYSKTIYTIEKVNKNSVDIIHNNDNKTVKKTDILIVKDNVEHIAPETEQIAMRNEVLHHNRQVRAGTNNDNVVREKRAIKPRVVMDL